MIMDADPNVQRTSHAVKRRPRCRTQGFLEAVEKQTVQPTQLGKRLHHPDKYAHHER